jgi:hypothetical protein
MSQLDGWGVLKSVNEDALTFMSSIGIFSRTTQDSHATTFHPGSSLVKQYFCDFIVMNNFEETKETKVTAVVVIESSVNGC